MFNDIYFTLSKFDIVQTMIKRELDFHFFHKSGIGSDGV